MIIAPTRRRRRARHKPAWLLRPDGLYIIALLLFLGALVWMLLVDLMCGIGGDCSCAGSGASAQWKIAGRVWLGLTALAFVLAAAYLRRYGAWLRRERRTTWPKLIGNAFVFSVMGAMLVSLHVIGWANITGPQRPAHYQGPVIDKRVHRGKSTSYEVVVRDVARDQDIRIGVGGLVYDAVRIGDTASCEWLTGRWGMVYRWERGGPRGCDFRASALSGASGVAGGPSRCGQTAGCDRR
ncbi:hypothetical protein [Pseudomonas sp. CGJS7]|uniref:hypothetical protein n=1 Tax=Pseudomonas sp. CGJS7 TaxID=3109348 RepID=UPI003009A2AD